MRPGRTSRPGSTDRRNPHQPLYNNARWRARRARQLRDHPLCQDCEKLGRLTPARVADHVTPHRGDPKLFEGPLRSLCASCHSMHKQAEERTGLARGCGADGMPLDPRHPWNQV